MNGWDDFFVAVCGAAAALTGLIFVGVSISLARILETPILSGRASEPLVMLVTVMMVSAVCLVPGQGIAMLGLELLCMAIASWVITLRLDVKMLRNTPKEYKRHYTQNLLFSQCAILPYFVSAIMLLSGHVCGLYWLVPGILLSFAKSVLDAWVLLVEIHR
jgi:hypothetical protein